MVVTRLITHLLAFVAGVVTAVIYAMPIVVPEVLDYYEVCTALVIVEESGYLAIALADTNATLRTTQVQTLLYRAARAKRIARTVPLETTVLLAEGTYADCLLLLCAFVDDDESRAELRNAALNASSKPSPPKKLRSDLARINSDLRLPGLPLQLRDDRSNAFHIVRSELGETLERTLTTLADDIPSD